MEKRILVFGTAGTGKTSICNTLSGENRKTGNTAVGVTFESHSYAPFNSGDNRIILTDTIGLNEQDKGSVNSASAIKSLISLLKHSKEGYNLLVQVMKIGRITQQDTDNYKLFIETIAEEKIPTILVLTGCENVEPMSKWVEENKIHFDNAGMKYKQIVATCFGCSENKTIEEIYSKLRQESAQIVLDAIKKYSALNPIKIYENQKTFLKKLKTIWNWFCDNFELQDLKFKINEKLIELFQRLGFSQKEAKELESNF